MDRYEKIKQLFPEDFEKLQNTKILLLGVGGVGGLCLDCLHRSGITDITAVDCDRFDLSNQNRQLGSEATGEIKVERFAKTHGITPLHETITPRWVEEFDFTPYDFVIDAIDDMRAKVAVAHRCSDKLISSTGSARKTDPTKIEVASIWQTSVDPLARKFRYELKRSGFSGDFPTVYSTEQASKNPGSFMGVTGSFGLAICSFIVRKITA